jgi:hypothetical protein
MPFVDAYSELEDMGDEEPWCDMVFDLVDTSESSGGILSGTAMAATPRGDIGFAFDIPPAGGWHSQRDDDFVSGWADVTFRSIGAPTDRLLSEYETWFRLPSSGSSAVAMLKCLTVLIGEEARDLEDHKLHMKVFFDPDLLIGPKDDGDRSDMYAELFFNLDMPNRRVELREKDPEYRQPLVGWLGGQFLRSEVLQ